MNTNQIIHIVTVLAFLFFGAELKNLGITNDNLNTLLADLAGAFAIIWGVIVHIRHGNATPPQISPEVTNSNPPQPVTPPQVASNEKLGQKLMDHNAPLVIALGLAALLFVGTANAQTNSPIMATNILGNNPVGVAVQDVVNIAKPLAPYLLNSNITLSLGGGENTSSHSAVALGILTVPVGSQTSLGIIGGYANGGWYEGGAAVQWGVTNVWPVLGTVRSIAGDGIVYNIANREPANYSYGGFEKSWVVNNQWTIGASIVTANTSDAAGVDIIGFLSATYHW
jgi:hypothetical protein